MAKGENLTFEKALGKLETLVQELERGELPLEKSLEKYEEGIKLVRHCRSKLEQVEKRVEILRKREDGTFRRELLNIPDNSASEE